MPLSMRPVRWPAAIAFVAAVLVAIGGATYWYTVEPAPAVKVRWRAEVTPEQRRDLERQFRLVDAIAADGRTITYNLLDTSAANLEALVTDSAVEDTSDIDRTRYTLPPDIAYGTRWMWAADRIAGLRRPGVVPAIVGLCAVAIAGGIVAVWRPPTL